jgi:hypothetical protein
MKKTLSRIIEVISKEAEAKRDSAAYGGERGDGGASRLESELNLFVEGIRACSDAYIDEFNKVLSPGSEFKVPDQWTKYFIEEDKEYQDYLRLKEKFEKQKKDSGRSFFNSVL